MIIHIDVYFFVTPYKMEIALMKFDSLPTFWFIFFVFFSFHFIILQHVTSTTSLYKRNRNFFLYSEKIERYFLFFLTKRYVINLYHDFLFYYLLISIFIYFIWLLLQNDFHNVMYKTIPIRFYLKKKISFTILFKNMVFTIWI